MISFIIDLRSLELTIRRIRYINEEKWEKT